MPSQPGTLQNGDRVAVVGGGPAGSFFAIHLLRQARRLGRTIEVVILEKRGPAAPNSEQFQCRGCNFCAGLISPRLQAKLGEQGLVVPEEIIQGRIEYVWIQGEWKNFRLRVPPELRMFSVFRGSLPGRRSGRPTGFDGFLLGEAAKEGAHILYGEVRGVARTSSGMPSLRVAVPEEADLSLDAALVVVASGINAHCGHDYSDDPLMASVKQLNPGFVPARCRKTLIFELDVGEDYLARNMRREIYFIESAKPLALEHTALIPKGRFLTVAMIGKVIDEATLPRDSHQIVQALLALPQIDRILPGIAAAPVTCCCIPRMTVGTAASPVANRFAIIGDAVGSRLNKDGLYSAYATATLLAETALHDGIGRRALATRYVRGIRRLAADNRFGRVVFKISRVAFTRPLVSRVIYQAFATEYKVRDERSRPLTLVLWKIASGAADYRQVFRQMCGYRVLRSILTGAALTLRNLAFEALFGLHWGPYGRYPTVVLKEKREAVKKDLARSLGEALDARPDYERMYAIKIRAPAEDIMRELANFGRPQARFVNLRFVNVRQTRGVPNQAGSVIRYRLPFLGLGSEMQLSKRVGVETLLYEVDRRLVEHGKLIFNVVPSKDGNRRLAIYTSFDYKHGRGLARRLLWGGVRLLFPGFVHDIVWNHALCTIKEEAERKHGQPNPAVTAVRDQTCPN